MSAVAWQFVVSISRRLSTHPTSCVVPCHSLASLLMSAAEPRHPAPVPEYSTCASPTLDRDRTPPEKNVQLLSSALKCETSSPEAVQARKSVPDCCEHEKAPTSRLLTRVSLGVDLASGVISLGAASSSSVIAPSTPPTSPVCADTGHAKHAIAVTQATAITPNRMANRLVATLNHVCFALRLRRRRPRVCVVCLHAC